LNEPDYVTLDVLGLAVPAVPNLLFYVDRKTVGTTAPRADADTMLNGGI
jgi:hypothetical protein